MDTDGTLRGRPRVAGKKQSRLEAPKKTKARQTSLGFSFYSGLKT